MDQKKPTPPSGETSQTDARIKIYFLPNLMTGANLFCGFLALTRIVEWNSTSGSYHDIKLGRK